MKITMGRTMKILVAILIVAIIAIVMLSPYSFEKYTASSKMIQVTSTDTVTKDANGKKKQQVYSYKKDDKKYTELVNVLDQYSYHFTTKTYSITKYMSQKNNELLRIKSDGVLYLGVETNQFQSQKRNRQVLCNIVFIGNNIRYKGINDYYALAKSF